ncbi:hypothetical protein, partial [Rhizobium leguminosarum]|uniref:hypothetical protein n=1 Tax=Rhizobium leguminosarum TaxID=384 RepID=UPI0013EE4071
QSFDWERRGVSADLADDCVAGCNRRADRCCRDLLSNRFREWLTAFLKRKSEAEVLAFSPVTQLDHLISQCADVVDDPLHQDRETQCWESTTETPDFLFADGITWSVFPKALQYKIRSFPNKIDVTDRNIGSLWDYGDGPSDHGDAFEERRWRYSWIGLEACLINDMLAQKCGADTGEWDPEGRFKREIAKIDARRKDEAANPWPVPMVSPGCAHGGVAGAAQEAGGPR